MAFMTKEWKGNEAFPVQGFHHVEFYVGNAKQSAQYFRVAFGFEPYAYAGPETGTKDHVSYVLKQNRIFIVLTTPLSSRHPAADWLKQHGDSVCDVSISVDDPINAFSECLKRGASEAYAPSNHKDEQGVYIKAGIRTYGDTIHSFINSTQYNGVWAPGFVKLTLPVVPGDKPNLIVMDHIVWNVGSAEMNKWAKFYEDTFGFMTFVEFDESDISTQFSSLKSKVVRSKNWQIKMPINEPAKGLRKSQIEEFLNYHEGPGIQHIALITNDIIQTITALRTNGVEFLTVPSTYYDKLSKRVGLIKENIDDLRPLGILVDRDDDGYLLQLFTKPIEDRPTFFFEIIQRKGAVGFGQGNFQALFESIEREQALRGNL